MSVSESRKTAKEALLHGYRHHAYEIERNGLTRYFSGADSQPHLTLTLPSYADVLAPDRSRAVKNSVICFITVACRLAIEHGLDSEYSFAVSDYYVNKVELTKTEKELEALIAELLMNYHELIQQSRDRRYSRHVSLALRYIQQNIFDECKVSLAAKAAGVHPGYLCALFQKELDVSPAQYIMRAKLKEAKTLLTSLRHTVAEAAEALGFSSTAHFSAAFKAHVGVCPSQYRGESVQAPYRAE